jgi:nicotinamidase-related amidase
VRKHRFDIWQSQEFNDALSEWDIDGLIIGGVELICCVLYAVLGAEERGFQYVVPQDIVSGMRSSEAVANQAANLPAVCAPVSGASGRPTPTLARPETLADTVGD